MSLGLVVLEEKSLTRTYMPQSDDIMSADIKTHKNIGQILHQIVYMSTEVLNSARETSIIKK